MRRCCTGQIVNGKGSLPPDSWCPLGPAPIRFSCTPAHALAIQSSQLFMRQSHLHLEFPLSSPASHHAFPKIQDCHRSATKGQQPHSRSTSRSNAEVSYPSLSLHTFPDRLGWIELGQAQLVFVDDRMERGAAPNVLHGCGQACNSNRSQFPPSPLLIIALIIQQMGGPFLAKCPDRTCCRQTMAFYRW